MQTGTFSGAAREEGVSVQAVSKALAALEEELGQQVFLRKSKGAVPTAFGTQLYEYAKVALDAFDKVAAFATEQRSNEDAERTALKALLAVPTFKNYHAVCIGLERFLAKQLGMEVSFGLSYGWEAVPRLLSQEIDVLITVGEYENPLCDAMQIGLLPTGVFVGYGHPLAGRKVVSKADLAPYPVCYARGLDDFNHTIVNAYLESGLASRKVVVSSQEEFDDAVLAQNAYALGVGMPNFSTLPGGDMLHIAPEDNIMIPVYAVTARDYKSDRYRAFERFMLKEFSRVMTNLAI